MILRSETGRLVGAAAPELNLEASAYGMSTSIESPFQRSQISVRAMKFPLEIFGRKSGLVVAPFWPLVTSKRMA
jgi:hypothetical protein